MIQDISKAYFAVPATRDIYIELPPEEAEPGMVGKLEKSLYGIRDAAFKWADAYAKVLLAMGYDKGISSPVHGDDFLRMKHAFEASLQVKTECIGCIRPRVCPLVLSNFCC